MKEYKLRDMQPPGEIAPFTDAEEELPKEIIKGLDSMGKTDPALEEEKQPVELTEEFLLKYAEDKLRMEAIEESLNRRKETILALAGRNVGVAQMGKAIINKGHRSGQTKVDWEKWLKTLVADKLLDVEVVEQLATDKELVKKKKLDCIYISRGEDGVNLTIDVIA